MWLLRLLLVALASPGGAAAPSAATSMGAQCLGSACFALFWTARTFPEASGVCEAAGGHLMTVRSTVAAEAIALLLLRARPGSAWLGLHLPDGARPEAGKRLRGFEWVVGDDRTDYSNWTDDGAAAEGLLGPRCVVVTQHLSWEDRACDATADGFLCEYNYPGGTCLPLALPPSVGVSYLTPFGVRDHDLVALPPGTTVEVPSLDASLVCSAQGNSTLRWRSVTPGAWDCSLENGGCDGRCSVDPHKRPFCTCPDGKTLSDGDGRSCLSPCDHLPCQHFCVSQGDQGLCMCGEGYQLHSDGRSCKDIDDCKAIPGLCPQQCINTQGSYECRCFEDYELVKDKCILIESGCFDNPCDHDCVALDGKYLCTCFQGHVPDPQNPHKCIMFCNQTECPAQCDPNALDLCFCPPGYILEEKTDGTSVCSDINECEASECGDLKCENLFGSHTCTCPDGHVVQDVKLCEVPVEDVSGEAEPDSKTSDYDPKISFPTFAPPKDGSSPGMLVAIIVSSTLAVVVLVATMCYFLKKHCTAQATLDYKCRHSEAGVAL